MTEHIQTKKQLKEIADLKSFNTLLEAAMLSDVEKDILTLHYAKDKDFGFIADTIGVSPATVYKKHKDCLNKLRKLI